MLKALRSSKGFTLIELLIVVAIIGILAAIAIPQFQAYREKAFNSSSQSDLRNLKTGQEAFMADSQQYPDVLTTNP
jgi:type IV pilus assembly protein PilA